MSAPCPRATETRRLVRLRLDESLPASESRALKAHVAACAPCRAEALRLDPTMLFAPLADDRTSRAEESEARRLTADVLAAVDVERARRRIAPPPARRVVLRAASVALLVGALLTILQLSHTAGPAAAPPVVAERAEPPHPAPAPLIDDLRNPGATVYQFASTSAQEPNVVFVVDRNADI